MHLSEYDLLVANGNIGFYNSCEITQLFVQNKQGKSLRNLFMLVTFEEQPYNGREHAFLGERISIDKNFTFGIQRYRMSLEEIRGNFDQLHRKNIWDYDGNVSLKLNKLRLLPKQFVPSADERRLSLALKNNFINASYILEYFDDSKTNLEFLLSPDSVQKLNKLASAIKKEILIDLSVVRDRIGNVIFQFPVTLLHVTSSAMPNWNGIILKFSWHRLISTIPDCRIQVETKLDGNIMGSTLVAYNKTNKQQLVVGNMDQDNAVHIYRKNPDILVYNSAGHYMRNIRVRMAVQEPEKRRFNIEGVAKTVDVHAIEKFDVNNNKKGEKPSKYVDYIKSSLYKLEIEKLEANLSFKQYFQGDREIALTDIRTLILRNCERGVYVWDPFLRASDILSTLYFSNIPRVTLKAIGSITPAVRDVYAEKGKSVADIMSDQQQILITSGNNYGLNLEFRMQHSQNGWNFHDRFLIFPGDDEDKPVVYSLGTSINSLGLSHHILQEVSHPQRVIDAFNDLWETLNHPNCIVWKYP